MIEAALARIAGKNTSRGETTEKLREPTCTVFTPMLCFKYEVGERPLLRVRALKDYLTSLKFSAASQIGQARIKSEIYA